MQSLEVSGAVRPIYGSLGVKRLHAIDVRPTCDTSRKTCLRGFGGNESIAWTSAVVTRGAHIECI